MMEEEHNDNEPVNSINSPVNLTVNVTINANIIVPKFNKKKREHNELVKWLKSYCDYSDNAFKDQDYSDAYKKIFNITDTDGIFYEKGDIDYELNIGYADYANGVQKDPDDEELEQFIDHVPVSDQSRRNIVILPGTNHSNANYIYKIIKNETINHKYKIPYLSNNPSIPYNGNIKEAEMMINKVDVYTFVKENSKVRKY